VINDALNLTGKTALITGAAGGIGQATAALFLQAGASVALVDRDGARLREFAATLDSDRVHTIQADTTAPPEVEAYFAAAVSHFGALHIVFANAGALDVPMPIADVAVETWTQSIAVNLFGTFLNVRAAVRTFQRLSVPGNIICTASGAALEGVPTKSAYSSAKHGILGLVRSAALEVAREGIRINALLPGMTDTNMMRAPLENSAHGLDTVFAAEQRKSLEAKVPMGRWARPEEIAMAALFLASEMSSYMTGASLVVDGGLTV
jgi:NAD(P)-dependent dehydrogenase (short-subunit alcohol dehydrogenase family)